MTNSNRKCVAIHNGSFSTVAGFSNMELPQCIIPSSYIKRDKDESYIFGTFEMLDEAEKNEVGSNVYTIIDSRGLPYNWEVLEAQWRYIYKTHLKIAPEELPLVISVPASSGDLDIKVLESYFELAFTKLNVPVLQIVIEPLAITLSMGKSSALVVDIGSKGCKVTPIIDGTVVKSGVMKSKYGGDFLDFEINETLKETRADGENSCKMWLNSNTWIQQFKSTMLQVSDKNLVELERYYEEQQLQLQSQQGYQQYMVNPLAQKKNFLYKPKQKTITLELKDCYKISEYLFQPNLASDKFSIHDGISELMSKSIKKAGAAVSSMGTIGGGVGASVIVNERSINNNNINTNAHQNNASSTNGSMATTAGANVNGITPEQVYSMLLTNVIVTGSTSLINGMEQRIINELSIRFPQYKLTTYANQIMMDRKIQSWIAMSSIANLPNWDLGKWYSQQDYETHKIAKQQRSQKK